MTFEDLWQAAKHGRNDIVQALLLANVPINEKNRDGWTALHVAAWHGRTAVVQTLLDNNAIEESKSHDGWTALHFACLHGYGDVVQALLRKSVAAVEAKTFGGRGNTPLHEACSNGNRRCVLLLLAAGSDATARGTRRRTVCHCLLGDSVGAVMPALVAAGADLDAPDEDGKSARQILSRPGLDLRTLLSECAVEGARHEIANLRLDFVRHRALQVCIALQSRGLDALQMCEILLHACGPLAPLIAFHQWWKIATTVKHFH